MDEESYENLEEEYKGPEQMDEEDYHTPNQVDEEEPQRGEDAEDDLDDEYDNEDDERDQEEDDVANRDDDDSDDDEGDDDSNDNDDDEEGISISDEELDQIADTAIAALEDILKYFNLGEVTIDEYEGDEGELILDITGDDLAVLIGRHGKTLDALQFLISSITARSIGYRYPVVVDVEGYKSRQRQKLENLAFSAAKRALSQGKSVKMRPMTPYERRIIHIALREFEGVTTGSEGEGSARHVVVVPE